MKSSIIVAMTTLAVFSCADDPLPPTIEKSLQSYEESMKAADEQHQQSLLAAKDEYLKQLQIPMDSAFESKNLTEANELDAAIKSMTEKSVAGGSKSPIAVKAKQIYDETTVTVGETLRKDQEAARNTYQNQLQAFLDAALLAKDLEQANRIEAAMKSVTANISPTLKFALISAGQFTMGSRRSESGHERDEIQHRVVLTRPLEMSIYEVTQAQFESVMGANPSHFKGANNPVDQVTWDEAVEYCHRLSELPEEKAAGRAYRLPTESEWEYACRAGSDAAFSFGNDPALAGEYAWFLANSGGTSHPVGQKKPNAWGLYDMHGNVFEWCFDWYSSGPIPVSTDPQGAKSGPGRVLRGGAWYNGERLQRSANRGKNQPGHRDHGYGFRIVRTTSVTETVINTEVTAPKIVEANQPVDEADEPKSPSVAKSREIYEKALQDAEDERVATLKVAEDERTESFQAAEEDSLKDLQTALDTALKNKSLKEANKIAAAMKLMKEDSVLGDTTSPVVKRAMQTYDASVAVANGKYQEHASSARTRYLTDLEAAMDSAFERTDLEEANRIDAVIELLRAEAAREARIDQLLGTVTFMDIEGVGDTIVYLIEMRSSMGGNRLKVAKSQLKASLQRLQPNQKFAVIFYNEYRERLKLRRQGDQSMYFATDVNKELAGHEVDRVASARGADHMPALLEAISLKPDVIYFLTDGDEPELSPAQLAEIRRLAASLTIHVVRLSGGGKPPSRESTWPERLARHSSGEYREINIDTFLK